MSRIIEYSLAGNGWAIGAINLGVDQKMIQHDDEAVAVLTGTGLKATSFYASKFTD